MEEVLPLSAKEVLEIIWNSDIDIYEKISPKFICLLREVASKCNESVELLDNTPIMEQPITEDAKAIIALIFKDYIASEEERNRLNDVYIKKYENEIKSRNTLEKYENEIKSGNTLEKQENDFINEEQEITALIKLENDKWYKNFFNKIKILISKIGLK